MTDKEKESLERLYQLCDEFAAECRNREKGWINVDRSLPETEDNVLVHSINRENPPKQVIEIGCYLGGIWEDYIGENIEDGEWRVTHWMPLDNLMPEV